MKTLASFMDFAKQTFGTRVERPLCACASSAAGRGADEADELPWQSDPERLERICAYARSGYFNMGYTVDMFHPAVGMLPD
jgi:hypothetical protein